MKKAAGYTRVSTQGQADHGLGLEVQREAIEAYCKKAGLDLQTVYEDAGVSGSNGINDRRGWPALVSDLEIEKFTVVVVMRLDRLARDLMLQENMLANLSWLGGELISIAEPDLCTDDPSRTFFRQVVGAMAQYEKAMIVARLRGGRAKKGRTSGGYPGSYVPLGYRVEGKLATSRVVVDPPAAEVVKRIFRDYAKGKSMGGIARELQAEGVLTVRGGRWGQATIHRILTNEFYTGKTEGALGLREGHEAIITKRQFDACRRRAVKSRRQPVAAEKV
jgi:site-specific DNA recombinase